MSKNLGRKTIINEELINQIGKLKNEGFSINKISSLTKVSRSTVYKVLKTHLGYKSFFQLKKLISK